MAKYHVLLFAQLVESFGGTRSLTVELPEPTTAAALRRAIVQTHGALPPGVVVAANNRYVDETHELFAEDEIALIPPVSGG